MNLLDRLAAVQERGGRAVLFTVVEGEDAGAKFLVEEGETGVELAEQADEVIRGARNTLLDLGDRHGRGPVDAERRTWLGRAERVQDRIAGQGELNHL